MTNDLNSLMRQVGFEFEAAWRSASQCDHGCTYVCTEQKVVYTNTVTRMYEIERMILELEQEYN